MPGNLFKKTALLITSVILGLIFADLILEIFLSKTTIKWIPDPIVGSRLAPNQKGIFVTNTREYKTQIETNSQGWHDTEHSFDKPNGTYRILILGDSFVENFQVPLDKTFFKQLEKNTSKKVEVIAMGLGNTGTAQQLLLLENYGLEYHPDLVLHMFLTANDIKNNSPVLQNNPYEPYFKIENGQLVEIPFQQKQENPIKTFIKNLQIPSIILGLRQRFQEYNQNQKSDYPIDYHVYDQNYSQDYQNAWAATQKLILKAKDDTEKSGGKYILVSLANNEQVNKSVWDEALKTYPKMQSANLDLEKPDKMIHDFCDEQKLTCWQMLPFFKDYISKNPNAATHYHLDGHWNEVGTNLAADFLNQKISEY